MDEREAAIRALLPMVRSLARRLAYKVPSCDVEDLSAEGTLGAIRAVDTFDATRGIPLRAYARRLIYGAILNGVRRMDAVPEYVRREARRAERIRYELYAQYGRAPRAAEIAAVAGIDEHRLCAALTGAALLTPLSLDDPRPPGMREPAVVEDPVERLCRAERRRALASALESLPPREREIVRQHYFRYATFETLGRRLGVTRQRASQLHVRALCRLRRAMQVETAA